MKPRRNILLNVDSLSIEGIPLNSHQATQLHRSVERELSMLLSENGMHGVATAVPALNGPSIEIAGDFNAVRLGRQIAQSVYRSLNKVTR